MKSIKSLIADNAIVVCDGKQQTMSAVEIVVGDLVMLSMGDRVPADMRIVQVSLDLKFDRSLLTGERYCDFGWYHKKYSSYSHIFCTVIQSQAQLTSPHRMHWRPITLLF